VAGGEHRRTAEGAERAQGARDMGRLPEASKKAASGAASDGLEQIRVRNDSAANGYDRRDPHFSVASDEPTVEN
jgi:hypothetical protein